jgi:hypothetical protein
MEQTMPKKKKSEENIGSFKILSGRDARSGRFVSTTTGERIPKGIVKKNIDTKREGVSFSFATSHDDAVPAGLIRAREPKIARPIHTEVDIQKFAEELLITDSVIMDILAK